MTTFIVVAIRGIRPGHAFLRLLPATIACEAPDCTYLIYRADDWTTDAQFLDLDGHVLIESRSFGSLGDAKTWIRVDAASRQTTATGVR